MKTGFTTCAITALIAGTAVSTCSAEIIYAQNFENRGITMYPGWSTNQLYADHPSFSRFLGRYHNHTVTLNVSLPAEYVAQQALSPRDTTVPTDPPPTPDPDPQPEPPPAPQTRLQLLLEFDLYVIDSWDGAEQTHGEDAFRVNVNGETVFLETFANVHGLQSYAGSPTIYRTHLGYNTAYVDSIYRVSIPFDVYETNLARIGFSGQGLLGAINDESWGIDNVTVSMVTVTVPAPGAAAGVLGLGLLATRRRRR